MHVKIGFIIFGVKMDDNHSNLDLHWSFAFAVIGSILCLVAAILSVIHMKKSNLV